MELVSMYTGYNFVANKNVSKERMNQNAKELETYFNCQLN